MPPLKTYDIFISHAWRYNESYYRLEEMLNDASNFYWRNYSVPKHDPKINPNTYNGKQVLLNGLDNQIRPGNFVIILAVMYAHYSYWIRKEIEFAQDYGKPIIGLYPWGQINAPQIVTDAADEMVGWNTNSIVSAIRRHSL